MISSSAKKFCRDDISLIENYSEALADTTQVWYVHHINGEPSTGFSKADLIKMNMYYNRPASELKFVTYKMHDAIHGNSTNWGKANKGKQLSTEHKRKIAIARKGKKLSDDTKAKMSASRTGVKLTSKHKKAISDGLFGHVMSSDTKSKISAAMKGKHWSLVNGKRVYA